MANRQFKWRSPVQSGESLVQSGHRQFKVANRRFKVAIASSKWRSPIQSGDNEFQVAIASSKWRIASSKICHYTMALNGYRSFVIPFNSKLEKTARESFALRRWLTNLPRFHWARPDHVRIESSCCCFPGELVSFNPRHVTRSSPVGKRIWVGRYNNKRFLIYIYVLRIHFRRCL